MPFEASSLLVFERREAWAQVRCCLHTSGFRRCRNVRFGPFRRAHGRKMQDANFPMSSRRNSSKSNELHQHGTKAQHRVLSLECPCNSGLMYWWVDLLGVNRSCLELEEKRDLPKAEQVSQAAHLNKYTTEPNIKLYKQKL